MENIEKNFVEYVCPSLELIDDNIEWEEIDIIKDYEMLCKTLDDLTEEEQLDYLSDLIIDCLKE